MDAREKLVELLVEFVEVDVWDNGEFIEKDIDFGKIAENLIAHGVTVQEWISASEPPKENGYYLCVILFSAVGNKKKYRRKILFWEDNVWIETSNSFRIEKPLYWMPMAEMPQPPKGE